MRRRRPYAGGDTARSRLAPDLRAHGATLLVGQRRSFTFGGLTRDLAALLDRLRFPPAVVVGMSMGAGVAARLVAQFHAPHAVRRSIRLTQLPRSTPLRHVRDLRRISVPTVVVGAPSDPPHPFEIARIWASALPASRLVAAPARDADPAGYQACLTETCGQLVAQMDGEREIGS